MARPDNGSLSPAAARRLLYAIVVACVALTGGAAVIRPHAPPATDPQQPVVIANRLPFAAPGQAAQNVVVTVPPKGLLAQSIRIGIEAATVHGLSGHVGASP
jgi:hypothetical protein